MTGLELEKEYKISGLNGVEFARKFDISRRQLYNYFKLKLVPKHVVDKFKNNYTNEKLKTESSDENYKEKYFALLEKYNKLLEENLIDKNPLHTIKKISKGKKM